MLDCSRSIDLLPFRADADAIARLRWALLSTTRWDEFTERTADPSSPHHGLSDIWARFAPRRTLAAGSQPCEWYPSAYELDGLIEIVDNLMVRLRGVELGGVLVTRIPAGAECRPHVDGGWHAARFEKFGVQVASAPGQRFCFDDAELETRPGDVFRFDNSRRHWVTNPTPHERVTMIVCIRR